MKTKNLFIAILFFITGNCIAQTKGKQISSGKILFDISYPESQLDEQTMANLPMESYMYFKNDKVKIEVSMPMGKTTVLSDNKTGEGTMLMNMMGNKWAIKIDRDQMMKEKSLSGKPKIERTNESKVIAGYKCSKAVVTINTKQGEKTFDVWFTDELKIKNSFSSQIEGIDGFLMEYFNNQNGISMKMTAKNVEAADIADSEFNVPDGYEVKTMDDLKNMRRGGK